MSSIFSNICGIKKKRICLWKLAESTKNVSSSQLICFDCRLCLSAEKKKSRAIEYCSFHSNWDSDREWAGVGGRVKRSLSKRKTECEAKPVNEFRVELSLYMSEEKKKEVGNVGKKRIAKGVFFIFPLV